MKATRRDAYELMHEGSLVLGEIEQNGFRIDMDYCARQKERINKRIEKLRKKLTETKEVKRWKKVYGGKFNIDSNAQLADVLFSELGHTPEKYTNEKETNPSVDEESLKALGIPMVDDLLKMRALHKAGNTYLANIMRETVDGVVRPFFGLHLVPTYRGQSDHPSWHNIPVRIPWIAKLIRSCVFPREGNQIGELDYSQLEVHSNTWYHHDPVMIDYLYDDTKDMHRDQAMECYILKKREMNKPIRDAGKNGFVFPEFYGDYFEDTAKVLWNRITTLNLEKPDGTPLKEHLHDEGIKSYKAFVKHIKGVEHRFWHEKFLVYYKWREKHWRQYLRRGYFDMLTGFRCSGVMKKNEAINYKGQGTAFHCLLWSLIQLHKWMKREKLESLIIGHIHDSIIDDFVPDELKHILKHARQIMCDDIREHWPWINTPLKIEAEVAPVDESWYRKKEVRIAA